jgi:hypothetical protein
MRERRRFRRRPAVGLALTLTVALAARGARAESGRLAVGTHDPTLVAALSVAVSPRGMSVVELPEPLGHVADVVAARREISVPDVVAVVWLCDDEGGAHALCFCDHEGRLVVKPVSVTAPLAPPDAAALALSVKVLLGPAPGARASAPAAPRAPGPPPADPAPAAEVAARPGPPPVVVELTAGARLASPARQQVGWRLGLKGIFAPETFGRRLGVGVGVTTGPALVAGGPAPTPPAVRRRLDDLALQMLARGRMGLPALWLELDLGPSVHFLSVDAGPAAARRADLSLDALLGLVVPVGRYFVGVRAGGFLMLTSSSSAAGAAPAVALPRWNGEAALAFGATFR